MEKNLQPPLNLFKKIKINNIYQIFQYVDYFSIVDLYFVNRQFRNICLNKYTKKIEMIITSIKIYKKKINIEINEDLRDILKNNSNYIRKEVKPTIMNILSEYYYKLPVLKYYFGRIKNKNIKVINLEQLDVSKRSMKYLCYFIENNSKVEKINLSNNKLMGDLLAPLKECSAKVNNLKVLKFDNCIVDLTTMIHLNDVLKNSQQIEDLSLENCNIEDNMITLISSTRVKNLNLFSNKLTHEGVYHICRKFPILEKLNLGKNYLNIHSIIYISIYIKNENCNLKYLNLENNYMSSASISILLQFINCQLYELNLNNNILTDFNPHITSVDSPKFSPNYLSGLKTIRLAGNKFDQISYDRLFTCLKQSKNLKKLDISNNKFNTNLLKYLFSCKLLSTSIEKLKIEGCFLGQLNFMEILSEFLQQEDNYLKKLNISNNSLSNGNFKIFSDIMNKSNLISLNLSGNDLNFSKDAFKIFCESIKNNNFLKKLNLSNNYLAENIICLFDNISHNICLENLILDKNCISSHKLILHISQSLFENKILSDISLKSNDIDDNSFLPIIALIKRNKVLKKIHLQNNLITTLSILNLYDIYTNYLFLNKNNLPIVKLKSKSLNNLFKKEDHSVHDNFKKFKEIYLTYLYY